MPPRIATSSAPVDPDPNDDSVDIVIDDAPTKDPEHDLSVHTVAESTPAPVNATADQRMFPEYLLTTSLDDTLLDTSQKDMQWEKTSNGNYARAIQMDSYFLKSLEVNPSILFNIDQIPKEWSHVNLIAFYNGEHINGDTNKSIWFSVNNFTPFAIVHTTVRAQCTNGIATLQSRASKIHPISGDKQQAGIILAPVHVVRFEQSKQCVTMGTFLTMPDKVYIFTITRNTLQPSIYSHVSHVPHSIF